jgi:1-acyl-sn-glycerol-3-phosphate acyltransferase
MKLTESEIKRHRKLFDLSRRLAEGSFVKNYGFTYEPSFTLPNPFIAVANHNCDMDPFLMGISLPQLYYVASEHIFQNPIFAAALIYVYSPIARKKGAVDASTVLEMRRRLKQGCNIGIFPEGTRSADGRLGEPQPGMSMIASKSMSPILPVAVINTYNAMPKGSKFPKLVPLTVRIGRPLSPEELGLVPTGADSASGESDRKDSRRRLETAGRIVMEKINELLQEGDRR